MKKREDRQGDKPQQERRRRDETKRAKDLEPEKEKGREVKGGGLRVKV